MTLQWSKVRGTGYFLQYNQQWKTIPASDEDGSVTYTISSLNPATEYMCTLYSVFENARSTGVPLRVFTDHQHLPCGQGFCPSDHVCINGNGTFQCLDGCQHYTVLNDDWLSDYNVNGNSLCYGSYQPSDWYRMFVGQSSAQIPETCVQESRCSSYRIWSRTPHPVHYNETVTLSFSIARDSNCYYNYYYNSYNNYYYYYYYYNSNLMTRRCYGDFYVYKLPILPGCDLSYCAVPPHGFRSSGQNDTSITLLWNPVNSSVSFVLQFNGTESNISVPTGSEPATYTVSSLTPATKYTFTLFSVFENVTSSGISIDAVTAPQNVEIFKLIGLNDTSMTLQWSKVGGTGYILQYNQQWKTIPASDEDGPVTYTVSSLNPATEYMCTLYSVFENARSTGVPLRVFTDHQHLPCGQGFCPSDHVCINGNGTFQCLDGCQHYTVLNDDWLSEYNVNGNSLCYGSYQPSDWYRMFVGQSSAQIPETCVQESRCSSYRIWSRTPHPVHYNETVTLSFSIARDSNCYYNYYYNSYNNYYYYYYYYNSNLMTRRCYGDFYVYKLPILPGCDLSYCAVPPHGFRSSGQNETSITLLWNPVNSSVSFVLQFNGTELNISAPAGSGPATYTFSSLTPATKYTFTLFSVFENVRSSGISIDAVTAPQNVENFTLIGLNDTSMTLQWSKVRGTGYILQYNQQWKTIPASDEDGPVAFTVSSLSPATVYMCTLYSVFENARSTGVPLRVFTDHQHLPCGQGFCPSDHVCINVNGTSQCLDGCQHYTVLNDDWLSEYNVNGNSLCGGNSYSSDWYRMFLGQSSAQIPETCVQESRCSSYRVWSTTPHPVRYNESVTLSASYARDSDCYYSYYSYNIMARLCYGDFYVYKLPRLPGCGYSYCPVPPHGFRSSGQNETSITLLWNPVNSSVSFVLQFNGTESNISAPAGSGPATYTFSSLTPATKYTFTLFSVFENVRSSGISIDAVTAPQNVENFTLIGLNDTSMTLQWSKVRGTGYILQYNQQWKTIPASDEDGPVAFTVSSLSPATVYMCTLYSVFENARSTGVPLRVFTDHQHRPCGQGFCPSDHVCINVNGTSQCLDGCQHYTVLNDDWLSEYNVNGNSLCGGNSYSSDWYRMFLGQSSAQIPETCVQESRCSSYRVWSTTPHPVRYNESVTLSASYARDSDCYYSYYSYNIMARLCYGDFYVYKLPRLPGCGYSYCPVPPHGFRSSGQNETSITLLWNPVNSSVSFVLQFNGTESNISAPAGSGPATYTFSSLTPATKYTFTLFSVFENVRSSGISIDAVTAPQNVENFTLIGLNDTSMTLQWSKVRGTGYILQYNQQWKTIPASDEDGPVTYTVSSLNPATVYMCTLYSVFENARSTGVPLRVFTGKKFLDFYY
ncbi:uncharacterized protein LOC144987173 [Oryzias latipes]